MISKRVIIPFLFSSIFFFGQNKNEKIRWSTERPLTWEDFRATPEESNRWSANTNSGISYSWSYSTASGEPVLIHEVFSNFYPNHSWVKKVRDKEYLLAHEQLHFDISEIHARKLRKALSNYEASESIKKDLKKIYKNVEAERVAMQKKFDAETAHSEDRQAEYRWRKFVALKLKELAAYSR